jgi:hypothetical protein
LQGELILKFKVGLLLVLLSTVSCSMGGDIQRRYVISHVSDEVSTDKNSDFKDD